MTTYGIRFMRYGLQLERILKGRFLIQLKTSFQKSEPLKIGFKNYHHIGIFETLNAITHSFLVLARKLDDEGIFFDCLTIDSGSAAYEVVERFRAVWRLRIPAGLAVSSTSNRLAQRHRYRATVCHRLMTSSPRN